MTDECFGYLMDRPYWIMLVIAARPKLKVPVRESAPPAKW